MVNDCVENISGTSVRHSTAAVRRRRQVCPENPQIQVVACKTFLCIQKLQTEECGKYQQFSASGEPRGRSQGRRGPEVGAQTQMLMWLISRHKVPGFQNGSLHCRFWSPEMNLFENCKNYMKICSHFMIKLMDLKQNHQKRSPMMFSEGYNLNPKEELLRGWKQHLWLLSRTSSLF